ncbi:transcriptional activator NhaR [Noviherbaspirillum denitrificans]|uniref:LysR family transcriptional regulator n=1 Tax=Noviherbaspirillum denitrificans TaxID=1968433 RepID=A0A254TL78_9BURK|nr:transcriptional activator NhaR [Noviherbaspirillum denitrificans]OWW21363.1 LysR family transcriptional regulator [Noviherbaspirillum denitrificans]
MSALNYKHLHYFWVVAKCGGINRASEQLHLTPQTISGQVTMLEEALGTPLFDRVGRRIELNDTGRMVFSYADEIFSLGEELEDMLHHRPGDRPLQFTVGVVDSVQKSIAYMLLEPALQLPETLRIVCREGKLSALLAGLAIQSYDIVIADGPMPPNSNVRGYSHLLGECGITFFAAPALAREVKKGFPHSLDSAPFLLPGEDAAVRPRLLKWFERERIRPHIAGEFDDGALLKEFGEAGTGVFCMPSVVAQQIKRQYGVVEVGRTHDVNEQFYAISIERRLSHPAVVAISSAARKRIASRK